MYQKKRFMALAAVAIMCVFIINPSNVFARDGSGLPSLQSLVNGLSEKVDSIITNLTSTNSSVASLQTQVSTQKTQIDQLQKQIEELKEQSSNNSSTTSPVTISIASFSGVNYDGSTLPKTNLLNKKITITNASDFSEEYFVTTDSEGKANITLPSGLYLLDFNPESNGGSKQFFVFTNKVPNSKIALVSSSGSSFQIATNMYGGGGLSPSTFMIGSQAIKYLSQF